MSTSTSIKLEEVKPYLITNNELHRKTIPDLIVLTQGMIKRKINLTQYELEGPSVISAPAFAIISNSYLSHDATGYYLHFSPDYIANALHSPSAFQAIHFLKSNAHPVAHLSSGELDSYKNMIEQLLRDYRSHGENREKILFHQLLALLFRFQNLWQQTERKENVSTRYEKLIAQHFPGWTTVQEYADALHISANHLNKTVKSETGKPASSFLQEMTLLYAKVLLKENDFTSIAAISDHLKFSEASHFTRFFKKKTGMTPRQYRDD